MDAVILEKNFELMKDIAVARDMTSPDWLRRWQLPRFRALGVSRIKSSL